MMNKEWADIVFFKKKNKSKPPSWTVKAVYFTNYPGNKREGGHEVPQAAAAQEHEHPYDMITLLVGK
jgi:hypothetical protein